MWLCKEKLVSEYGFFDLECRPGVAVCRRKAKVSSLHDHTVYLPDRSCLVLRSRVEGLRGMTFTRATNFVYRCKWVRSEVTARCMEFS